MFEEHLDRQYIPFHRRCMRKLDVGMSDNSTLGEEAPNCVSNGESKREY